MFQDFPAIRRLVVLAVAAAPVLIGNSADAQARLEAIPGRPFGVGTVTLPLTADAANELLIADAFDIEEQDGRVFYPAFSKGLLREVVDRGPAGGNLTVSFLFTGDEPLRLTVHSPAPRTLEVSPRRQPPRLYNRALSRWWRQYNMTARQLASDNDFPPLIHTYLTSMLANRIGLRPPLISQLQETRQPSELKQTLELLAGSEKIRASLMRESMQARTSSERANLPVPADVLWEPLALPPSGEPPAVEPIVMRVPRECFYVRFGDFDNYLWFSRLLNEYAGDLARMVMLRGHNAHLNDKLQDQLAVHESALSELFGNKVIADVAIIGRDLYTQDGAAMGILFHAKSNLALSADMSQKRSAALAKHKARGATLETIDIAGREVSFLSTPDNRLRSFYVADGDFHLVTTSRAIAARFLETKAASESLGATQEFQHARRMLPIEREDTIFAYFSSYFFRGLVSPQYQIELPRRLRAVAGMQLVQLAELAARSEGRPHETIDDLRGGGFLSPGFGRNTDGSGPIVERDRVIDSLRGARGSLTPIPDVELRGVTLDEADRYVQRAAYYQKNWRTMDPLVVGVKRFALGDGNVERIVVDANVSPFVEEKYGRLASIIGPPTDVRVVTPENQLISAQVSLKGGMLLPSVLPHHLFLGVQDVAPGTNLQPRGVLEVLQLLRETPGYLGSWPKLGFLDRLPIGLIESAPDPFGFSRLLFGIWRWQGDGFSVLSFQRPVLDQTVRTLRAEPTDNPAQVRVRVGDLSRSQLSRWFSFLSYERATQTSVANAKLLHALSQQLDVPREDALQTAQQLLDTELVCSLQGEYELVESEGGLRGWHSTKWPQPGEPFPADYTAPLVNWFRGLKLDMTKRDNRMILRAELDIQRHPADEKAGLKLPLFDLLGSGKKDAAKKKDDDPFGDSE
jgi:hypothetical protein